MKIDIIGSVASGKTTLAAALSKKYNVPYYEKDNIVWERTENGDRKRTDEVRDKMFMDILSKDSWIVEGTPRKCLNESFEASDYILFLDIKTSVRLKRVFTRWMKQRMGKEKYNSKPTLSFLKWNIKWVLEFDREKKQLLEKLQRYGGKVKVFRSNEEATEFVESVYGTKV